MSSLRDLQRSLAYSAEQVRSRDKRILDLEQELKGRDITISSLQVELDKFKQIIEPVTKQSLLSIQSLVVDDKKGSGKPSPGRDGDRYSPLDSTSLLSSSVRKLDSNTGERSTILKTKRFAISAEPFSENAENAVVNKFPKALE